MRLRPSPVLLAALATALARGAVALSRLDEQELELYSGSLAWSLLQGMPLSPEELPVIPHNRGSVVLGVLLVPLFALAGPTLLAIKALAVALSAATAALFARALELGAGRVAAWTGAALYALLPPSFLMVDVLALGSHGDSLLPTLGALVIVLGARGPLGPARALALGAVLGLGVFASLQCAVALPAVVAAWGCVDPRFWRRPASLAVLAGALPWIAPALWMLPSGAGDVIVGQSAGERFLPGGVGAALAKLAGTLVAAYRRSWMFAEHGGAWGGWVWYGAGLVGLAACVRRALRREALAVFALLAPALTLALYAASNFRLKLDENLDGMGSRYLMTVTPAVALWIALAAHDLAAGGRRLGAALLAGAPLAAGAAGAAALLDVRRGLEQPPVRGTELPQFHGHLEHAGGDDLAARLDWLRRVDPDWPAAHPSLYRAVAPAELDAARARALGGDLAPFAFVELGRRAFEAAPEGAPWQELLEPLAAPERGLVGRGLGLAAAELLVARLARSSRAETEQALRGAAARFRELAEPAGTAALEGLGFRIGARVTPYQPVLLRLFHAAEALDAEELGTFYRAAGAGYRVRFAEGSFTPPPPLRIEDGLSPAARGSFRWGLEPEP